MIQYMPFTYISASLAGLLTRAVGPLAVWQPLDQIVPDYMHDLAREGLLQWRKIDTIDPVQLGRAAQSFNQWADLHQGRAGELNTHFMAAQGFGGQESSVQQIRSQIRRWGETGGSTADTDLFQAALFLCLAHRYDQQQDALAHKLGAVRRLEARFGQLLGETDDPDASIGPVVSPAGDGIAGDPGLFMTERRLHAWGRLAATHDNADGVFLTTSKAVWEYLMGLFPDCLLATIHSTAQGDTPPVPTAEMATLLENLSQDENPRGLVEARCGAGCRIAGCDALSLAVVIDTTPSVVLARIRNEGHACEQAQAQNKVFRHTVLGYLRF